MVQTTPRDNLLRMLDGGSAEWIPFTLDIGAMPGFTEPIQRTFQSRTGADDPAEYFATDVRRFSLKATFGGSSPAEWHGSLPEETEFDEWGNGHWAGGAEGTVDQLFPVLASAQTVQDVDALPSPRIETDLDTSAIDAFHEAGYPVFGYGGSVYEWSWWVRGMEQFWMDLASDIELAEAIIEKVAAHTTRLAVESARRGIDVVCFYDDAGMQQGMQIDPSLWRRLIKPAWRRVLETVRKEVPAAKFFLHSCGKIDAIVPDIVELGFHILHPVQPECMDFEALYREFGRDIVLSASLSSQRLLPFGTPEEVRREVFRLAELVEPDRRCFLMPSNVIQPETPWANVVAFAEAARSLRPNF